MLKPIPAQLIFQTALKEGLSRRDAQVFSILAFWDQIEGGAVIRGQLRKWRTSKELAEATGYSERTVTRALEALRGLALIDSEVIWSPARTGTRVNAFRILQVGLDIAAKADESMTERRSRKRHPVRTELDLETGRNAPPEPVRVRHLGQVKYSEPDQRTAKGLITLPAGRENQFTKLDMKEAREKDIERWFASYLELVTENPTLDVKLMRAFWSGLADAVAELRGEGIEPFNEVIGGRVKMFLTSLNNPNFRALGPLDPCGFALWARLYAGEFNLLVQKETGVPAQAKDTGSYKLSRYGFLVMNRIASDEREKAALESWMNGGTRDFP